MQGAENVAPVSLYPPRGDLDALAQPASDAWNRPPRKTHWIGEQIRNRIQVIVERRAAVAKVL